MIVLLIAITGQLLSSISPTAVECSQSRYSNGSVEFRFSPKRTDCLREWRYNDEVLAYDDDEGKTSSGEHVVALTSDSLLLKWCIDNITYKEDCLHSQLGERIIPYFCNCSSLGSVVLPPDDDGRHHYFAVIPALAFIVSSAVLGFLWKLNLCRHTTRLTEGEQCIV